MSNPNLGAEKVDIKRGEGIVNELQGFRGKKFQLLSQIAPTMYLRPFCEPPRPSYDAS